MAKKELGKLGFEAIEYAIRKFLTKKPEGLATIPGQNMKARIKVLVDKYATMFRMKGQNVNTVTVKQVENEIDYGVSLQKQRAKEEGLKRFPKETHKFFGRPLKEQDFKEIDKLYPPKKTPTTESLLKGEKYTDERGRTWDFGTKDRPFPGFNPKIVPKETAAQIKARMIKENRSNVQKSYLRQLDKKIMDEMDMTVKDLDNMSSTALDDLRRNADPVGMRKQFDEITEGRGVGDFPDDPFKEPDYASGGIAGELRLNRPGYDRGIGPVGEGQYSPTKGKDWIQTMPMIDSDLSRLIEEYKKRKGLAEILEV